MYWQKVKKNKFSDAKRCKKNKEKEKFKKNLQH